jgi:hypothetical protein
VACLANIMIASVNCYHKNCRQYDSHNGMLRRIFGSKRDEVTGEWRKLHSGELHYL